MNAVTNQPKQELRRARILALVMASLTVLCLLFFVYAFIQKTQAEAARAMNIQLERQLELLQQAINDRREGNQTEFK